MMALHQSIHASNGLCLWNLLSLVVLGIIVVAAGVHMYRQKRCDDKFRDKLEGPEPLGAAGK